jgi:cathepsin L
MSIRTAVLASVAAAALAMPIVENLHDRAYYEAKFFDWMTDHQIAATSGEHLVKMIQNFANNDDLIATTNAQNLPYQLGHNQFSHMSRDEWRAFVKLGLARPEVASLPHDIHPVPADVSSLATSIDWTTKGAVTGVKDQGQCGSCWSFSATGALEGAYYNKYSSLVSFSEQNLVDCDNRKHGGTDLGCNGGLMDSAFDWVKKNGGLCTESGYPYTGKDGTCATTCSKNTGVAPSKYVDVTTNSESALVSALNIGPVSVAIEADEASFQLYKSGILTASCGDSLDHGVLAVGYDSSAWKVKNSWGSSWGESGYIRLARGVSQKTGQCGILSGPPSYPVL